MVQPASRPALVATDLDGTLLRSDGTVSSRTRAVLDDVERRGALVVFVTGRPLRWMDALWAHVGAHGLAICSNGGIVYDVAARAVRQARPVTRAVALEVVERLRNGVPGSTFALERTTGFAQEPAFRERDAVPPEAVVGPLPEILDDATVKILVRHEAMDPEEFWAATEAVVGDLVTTTWSSVGALVEISAAGVTKATTLALLCKDYGIEPGDVVAFGDMPNDLPMLEWAGTSYAMAGAHHSVVAAADHVAPGNDEDGVAHVLEALFELEAGPPPDRAGTRR